MKAARTTRESASSDMRPPCHQARTRSRHLLLWAFVPRVQPRATAVFATLGPAMAVSPSGTLVATQSMEPDIQGNQVRSIQNLVLQRRAANKAARSCNT